VPRIKECSKKHTTLEKGINQYFGGGLVLDIEISWACTLPRKYPSCYKKYPTFTLCGGIFPNSLADANLLPIAWKPKAKK
jgi:hypothetical protein